MLQKIVILVSMIQQDFQRIVLIFSEENGQIIKSLLLYIFSRIGTLMKERRLMFELLQMLQELNYSLMVLKSAKRILTIRWERN